MTSAQFTNLMVYLGILSGLLLLGMFLRAKVTLFKQVLLPASVIGGFIGLLLGPELLGGHAVFKFSEDCLITFAALPGFLMIPIFASVPLGNGMGSERGRAGITTSKALPKIIIACGLAGCVQRLQRIVGFGYNVVSTSINPDNGLYRVFGYELCSGFGGGHGPAAGMGKVLEDFGLDYWQTSMGVCITYATIGLVGGMMIGIILINFFARRGMTKIITEPGKMPVAVAQGYTTNIAEQKSLGRETTNNSSIESISIYLAILFADSALALIFSAFLIKNKVPGLAQVPAWFFGLFFMYIINFILVKLKLDWLIDKKAKTRVTGALADYAIIASVVSLSLKTVATLWIPITITCILGFLITFIGLFPTAKKFFGKDDYPVERAVINWGVATGTMIEGMMLLKICDPDYTSPVMAEFSSGYALMCFITMFTTPLFYGFLATESTAMNLMLAVIGASAYFIMAIVGKVMLNKANRIKV